MGNVPTKEAVKAPDTSQSGKSKPRPAASSSEQTQSQSPSGPTASKVLKTRKESASGPSGNTSSVPLAKPGGSTGPTDDTSGATLSKTSAKLMPGPKPKSKSKSKDKAKSSTALALDETVDGGYLHDHGVYKGPKDYDHAVVYQLVVERKLAPFYKGLEDVKQTWTDRQLLAAIRGLPIPEAKALADDSEPVADPGTETETETETDTQTHTLTQAQTVTDTSSDKASNGFDSNGTAITTTSSESSASSPSASSPHSIPAPASIASDSDSTTTAEFPLVQASSFNSMSISPSSRYMSTSLPMESTLSRGDSPGSIYGNSASGSHRTINSNSDDDSLASTVSTAATSAEEDDLLRHVLSLKAHAGHIEDTAANPAATDNSTITSTTETTSEVTTEATTDPSTSSTSTAAAAPTGAAAAEATSTNQTATAKQRLRSKTTSQFSNSTIGSASVSGPGSNMKPIEVVLYREAIECPICFLYHPKYINYTRCCSQAICTECFVEIKRPEPHRPHHEDNDSASVDDGSADLLVSEPASCPYCQAPDFGVIYIPPPFKSGLCSAGDSSSNSRLLRQSKAFFSGKKANSSLLNPSGASSLDIRDIRTIVINASKAPENITSTVPDPSDSIRRRGSVPPTAPEVITTDQIRPDWVLKLTSARHHVAKRSAAASALHATAFVPSPSSSPSMSDSPDNASLASSSKSSRSFKNRLRGLSLGSLGGGSNSESSNSSAMSAATARALYRELAMESFLVSRERDRSGGENSSGSRRYSSVGFGGNSKTSRQIAKEVEEMMMMEAIRLSLYDQPNGEAEAVAAATSAGANVAGIEQSQSQAQDQKGGSNAKSSAIHA